MIAVGDRADLTMFAISELRRLPIGRDVEQHMWIVWMNYSDQFMSMEAFLQKVVKSVVNFKCKVIATELLTNGRQGRWA